MPDGRGGEVRKGAFGMKRVFGFLVLAAIVLVTVAPAAFAQRSYGTGTPPPSGPPVESGGPSVEPNVVTPPEVLGQQVTPQVKSQVETLPFTGADIAAMVLVGAALVVMGVALVRGGRRAGAQVV